MSNADSQNPPNADDAPVTGLPIETAPAADDTPIRPASVTTATPAAQAASALAATTPGRSVTPRHPMPAHFPEVQLPMPNNPPPAPAYPTYAPVVTDPHSIHDGRGYQPERLVCIRCGSTNVARGQIVQHSHSFQNTFFAPRRMSLGRLNSLLNLFPFRALLKLEAIACRDCGAVLPVIDPAALRKVEKIRE